jgi:hypothetical protein
VAGRLRGCRPGNRPGRQPLKPHFPDGLVP